MSQVPENTVDLQDFLKYDKIQGCHVLQDLCDQHSFKNITNEIWQSWSGFVSCLRLPTDIRKEFDIVEYKFCLDSDKICLFEFEKVEHKETVKDSLAASYFGRDLDYTIYKFSKSAAKTLKDCFHAIDTTLEDLFQNKQEHCVPQLYISNIKIDSIYCYYTWQYK